ncbi:MAG: YiiX family permuted papain-like enzyme [Bacteroidia bacterium]
MKKALIISSLLLLLVSGAILLNKRYFNHKQLKKQQQSTWNTHTNKNTEGIHNGDLIFQTSLSAQSQAIQLATKSEYSHCGIIYKNGSAYYVFEAVQPVKLTPLSTWIDRGKDKKFVIKRLKNADEVLTPAVLLKMKQVGDQFKGKNYDLTFEWSDDKIYCSELIWKIYQRAAGIELGTPEKLKDFDLSNEIVKKKMKERYGERLPMEETVISPAAIFNSDLLITVKSI